MAMVGEYIYDFYAQVVFHKCTKKNRTIEPNMQQIDFCGVTLSLYPHWAN